MADETNPAAGPEAAPPGPGAPPAAARLIRLAVGFYAIVTLFAVGYALFSERISVLLGTRDPDLPGFLAAIGIAALLVGVTWLGSRAWGPMRRMVEGLRDMVGTVTPASAAVLALLSGVAEELLFRGALWHHLGFWGTTFLFGLVHVLPKRSLWLYPVFALVAGGLLGLLRYGKGNVLPPMLAHVLVNFVNLLWIGRVVAAPPAPPPPPPPAGPPG